MWVIGCQLPELSPPAAPRVYTSSQLDFGLEVELGTKLNLICESQLSSEPLSQMLLSFFYFFLMQILGTVLWYNRLSCGCSAGISVGYQLESRLLHS